MLSLLSKSESATKTDQRQENEIRIFHLYLVNLTVLDIQRILSSRIVVPLTSVPHFILHRRETCIHAEKRSSWYTDVQANVGTFAGMFLYGIVFMVP